MSATNTMQRPRPFILGLLAVTLAVAVIWAVWPAASQPPAPSNQRDAHRAEAQGTAGRGGATRPGDLEVRLEDLKQPPAPPIPLKFIGTLEKAGMKKQAVFSDGRGMPLHGAEGDLILGQYRVVRIGVESVVMEYSDGRGRQTIPMRGGQ